MSKLAQWPSTRGYATLLLPCPLFGFGFAFSNVCLQVFPVASSTVLFLGCLLPDFIFSLHSLQFSLLPSSRFSLLPSPLFTLLRSPRFSGYLLRCFPYRLLQCFVFRLASPWFSCWVPQSFKVASAAVFRLTSPRFSLLLSPGFCYQVGLSAGLMLPSPRVPAFIFRFPSLRFSHCFHPRLGSLFYLTI